MDFSGEAMVAVQRWRSARADLPGEVFLCTIATGQHPSGRTMAAGKPLTPNNVRDALSRCSRRIDTKMTATGLRKLVMNLRDSACADPRSARSGSRA